jgi:exonuclease SbcD
MRLLHVSDWHLGRETDGASRRPDHEAALDEIVTIARDFRPHLVVHTGDVFDSPHPGADDIDLAFAVLHQLADLAPVEVIAGNHDGASFFRSLTRVQGRQRRIRLVDQPRHHADGGVIEYPGEDAEVIRLATLPFIHAGRGVLIDRFSVASSWHAQYADGIREVAQMLAEGLAAGYNPGRHVLVFAAHLHIAGAVPSGTERRSHVTDSYAAQAASIPAVSYAAFGHIHKPQRLPGPTEARYAGSPIPIDFGEEGEEKSVVLVEATPGRPPDVRAVPLRGGRALRSVRGTLSDIAALAPHIGNALCRVIVQTESLTPHLSEAVHELLPNATILSVSEDCAATRVRALSAEDNPGGAEDSLPFLFREFLAGVKVKNASAEKVLGAFDVLIGRGAEEAPIPFPEERVLEGTQATEKVES